MTRTRLEQLEKEHLDLNSEHFALKLRLSQLERLNDLEQANSRVRSQNQRMRDRIGLLESKP